MREVTRLDVLKELMGGARHSRRTLVARGISLKTADRWLRALLVVPGVRREREGKTTWFVWSPGDRVR